MDLLELLAGGRETIFLDGAMGTQLGEAGLEMGGQNCVTHPDAVLAVHRRYAERGIDLLITNTLTMNRVNIESHSIGVDVREVNLEGARLAREVIEAVRDADFIYTDLWWWVGQEDEIPDRQAAFMPKYQVNMDLLRQAPAHCKFMHCLPASRGVEATDEVMDSPQSIIFDQAENRLHTEKGILVWLVYPRLKKVSEELRGYHQGKVEAFLNEKF